MSPLCFENNDTDPCKPDSSTVQAFHKSDNYWSVYFVTFQDLGNTFMDGDTTGIYFILHLESFYADTVQTAEEPK